MERLIGIYHCIFFLFTRDIMMSQGDNVFEYVDCINCIWDDLEEGIKKVSKIPGIEEMVSKWPPGPYALPKAVDGCPENKVQGWEEGYIDLTFSQPRSVFSNWKNDTNSLQHYRDVTLMELPDIQSYLLGPFCKYRIKLNFCVKLRRNDSLDNGHWPNGNYSIYGANSGCPNKFSERQLKLQFTNVVFHTYDGNLPHFELIQNNTDIDLLIRVCSHVQEGGEDNNDIVFDYPFILLHSDMTIQERSGMECPVMANSVVILESLYMKVNNDVSNQILLFHYCYYKLKDWKKVDFTTTYSVPEGVYLVRTSSLKGQFSLKSIQTSDHNENLHRDERKDISVVLSIDFGPSAKVSWRSIDISRTLSIFGIFLSRTGGWSHLQTFEDLFCYYDDKRWTFLHFEAMACTFNSAYTNEKVGVGWSHKIVVEGYYLMMKRIFQSRYVTLLTDIRDTTSVINDDVEMFVLVTRYSHMTDENARCNNDMGMTDFGINDYQISVSSSLEEFPAINARPFSSSWCASSGDILPFIQVDFYTTVRIEGITAWNWEHVYETVINGSGYKHFLHMGTKAFTVMHGISENNMELYSKIFRIDSTYPIEEQQSFIFEFPFVARFIQVRILEPLVSNVSCLRFELHGCRKTGTHTMQCKDSSLLKRVPNLVNPSVSPNRIYQHKTMAECKEMCIEDKACSILQSSTDGYCAHYGSNHTKNWLPDSVEEGDSSWSIKICNDDYIETPFILYTLLEALKYSKHYSVLSYISVIKESSILTSIGFPFNYGAGESYTWTLSLKDSIFMRLIFTELSLNTYEADEQNSACKDSLIFDELYSRFVAYVMKGATRTQQYLSIDGAFVIDNTFDKKQFVVDIDIYKVLTLTFISCDRTEKLVNKGKGFRIIVRKQDLPACSSLNTYAHLTEERKESCGGRNMTLASMSSYNVPFSGSTEKWGIYLSSGAFLRIQMIHFDIECGQDTVFSINEDAFCNFKRPPSVLYTDPGKYVTIVFTSRNNYDTFQLKYEKVIEDIPDAITTKAADVQGILQSEAVATDDEIDEIDSNDRNIPRILYKACSEKFGKCYSLFSYFGSWDFASGECWIRRQMLLSVSSLEEVRFIKYLLRNFKLLGNVRSLVMDGDVFRRAYIGLRRGQRGNDGNAFFWEDRSLATIYAWRKGHPSTGNCTYMGFHKVNEDLSWETQICSETAAYYFVCEAHMENKTKAMEDRVSAQYHKGNHSVTVHGYTCQRWDSQYPHAHHYTHPDMFHVKNVAMAENFCRDPTQSLYNLWCYTTNSSVETDMCFLNELNEEVSTAIYKGYLDRTVDGTMCMKGSGDGLNYCRNHYRGVELKGNFYHHIWCLTNKDGKKVAKACSLVETARDRCITLVYSYNGVLAHTVTGKICKRWDLFMSQEQFLQLQFPDEDVVQASNFCRDPTAKGFLWCYTDNYGKVWEFCLNLSINNEGELADNVLPVNYFDCKDGKRVYSDKQCNGKIECNDLSDETNCIDKVHPLLTDIQQSYDEAVINNVDERLFFRCQNYEVVSFLARCDGVIDCSDATDENDCTFLMKDKDSCEVDQFMCDNGRCIHVSLVCNFIQDCIDASDENCEFPSCTADEYQCSSGQCIPISGYCNAFPDCIDGSDENVCESCQSDAFHCDYVRCLPNRLYCDKYLDCSDGKDELSCDNTDMTSCRALWEDGTRESGMYSLYANFYDLRVLVYCEFGYIYQYKELHTIYPNVDITEGENGEMTIFTSLNGLEPAHNNMDLHLLISLFSAGYPNCTQEIVQRCKPAFEEAAVTDDPYHEHVYSYCACIVVTLGIGLIHEIESVRYCNDSKKLEWDKIADLILFEYKYVFSDRTRKLQWKETNNVAINNILLEIGNITCKEEYDVSSNVDVACSEGRVVFNESVRCVYDTDFNGIMAACRSGSHLESCGSVKITCPIGTVKCPDSYCIPLRFVCDGVEHCPKAEDEHGCGCTDTDTEVLILYEERADRNPDILQLAKQLYTPQSVIRLLAYRILELPPNMNQNYMLLQIKDKEFKMSEHIDRNYECEYKMLANEFLKSIEMIHKKKAIVYIQSSPESEQIANLMFDSLRNKPSMIIYRAIEDPSSTTRKQLFPYVNDVVVPHWRILSTLASRYLREICDEAFLTSCPGAYKCSSSKMCVTLDQVCDDNFDCIHGDDEMLCGFDCPSGCSCRGYAMTCDVKSIQENDIRNFPYKTHWLKFRTNLDIETVIVEKDLDFPLLYLLNLSSCNIREIHPNSFLKLLNLKILDLSNNMIKKLFPLAFIGLRLLQTLILDGNKYLEILEPFTFSYLSSIKSLHISNTKIKQIVSNTFADLTLERLVISSNELENIEEYGFGNLAVDDLSFENNLILTFDQGIFKGLSGLKSLRTPAFKYCCVRPNYLQENNCFPSKDEFSSCEDLMRTSVLQTMLWLIGLSSLLGNVLSIIYRLKFDRERLKLGYGIFVTNLAIADFLMGVYLIIIAIADAVFRKRYIFMDDYWRGSFWCTFAGVLSTISSESSVMFLCLITLDRILVIKYPFGQVRFDTRKALICSLVAWLLCLLMALFPLMYSSFFKGSFYTKSGVCIALPLTRDRPPGWLYSVLVFVVFNFITFLLIAVGQWSIFMDIQKQGKGLRKKGQASRRRDLVIARNLLLVVGTDFLCWFPIGCVGMMALSGRVISGDVYAWSAVFVLPINSALNPILYTLTAIIGKKSFAPRADEHIQKTMVKAHGKRFLMMKYVVMRRFPGPDTSMAKEYQSVEDILQSARYIKRKVILKITYQLAQTLSVLHKSSMIIAKIEEKSVFLGMENKEVQGDLQIRKEPVICKTPTDLCNDMYEVGVFLRKLLRKTY